MNFGLLKFRAWGFGSLTSGLGSAAQPLERGRGGDDLRQGLWRLAVGVVSRYFRRSVPCKAEAPTLPESL